MLTEEYKRHTLLAPRQSSAASVHHTAAEEPLGLDIFQATLMVPAAVLILERNRDVPAVLTASAFEDALMDCSGPAALCSLAAQAKRADKSHRAVASGTRGDSTVAEVPGGAAVHAPVPPCVVRHGGAGRLG